MLFNLQHHFQNQETPRRSRLIIQLGSFKNPTYFIQLFYNLIYLDYYKHKNNLNWRLKCLELIH